MTTYKVRLQGSNAKEYVTSFEGLWEDLKKVMTYDEKQGWNGVTRALREDMNNLRDIILSEILVPKAKDVMLQFLKDHPNVKTREFYHKAWSYGERNLAWYRAKEELEAEGKIVSESHGKGQNRTWKVKEA